MNAKHYIHHKYMVAITPLTDMVTGSMTEEK
jgi:hypothetical protein